MSYRSAVRRLVLQTANQRQQARKNHLLAGGNQSLSSHPSWDVLRPALPCIHRSFQEERDYSGREVSSGSNTWDECLHDHVNRLKWASFGECSSAVILGGNDSGEFRGTVTEGNGRVVRDAGAFSGAFERRDPDSDRISNAIRSTHSATLGYAGDDFSKCSARFGRFHGGGRGPMRKAGLENVRYYSSTPPAVGESLPVASGEQLDAISGITDAASTVVSVSTNSGTRAISEVAAAVADCSYPTAAIQYVIEGVHLTTGLPWWLSIAATTVAIRILVLPILVYQMKATARLTLMRPELEKLTNHIKENNYEPKIVEENQARMKLLFQEHKTSPLSPILGAFVQAPIFMCFFFAIRNMAENLESFKEGGTLWFTDLSTPDSLFIMPVLSGAMFLLTVELGATDGMQGQPMLGKMKMFLRGLAVLLVPLTANFPKALFCYWLTANVCSLVQAAVFKQPGVKAGLGIPDVSHMAKTQGPIAPVMTFSQPPRPQSKAGSPQGGGEKVGTYVSKKRRA